MAGMSDAALGNNSRTAAEIDAARANVAAVAPERSAESLKDGATIENYNRASSDFSHKFISALNLTEEEQRAVYGHGIFSWFNAGGEDALRETVLANRTPNEMLDALAKADPSLQQTVDLVKADPELAKSLHSAIVKDETMLPGLQKIFASGNDGFNQEDLQNILRNDAQRNYFKQVLDKVAEGKDISGKDINFSHVERLLSQHKAGDKAGMLATMNDMGIAGPGFGLKEFMKFLSDLMQNPEMAVNNLVNSLVESGAMDAEHAQLAKGFLVPVGEMAKFMAEPYHDLVVKYDIGAETPGRIVESFKASGAEIEARHGAPQTTNGIIPEEIAAAKAITDTGVAANTNGTGLEVAASKVAFNPNASGDATDGYRLPGAETQAQVAMNLTRSPMALTA